MTNSEHELEFTFANKNIEFETKTEDAKGRQSPKDKTSNCRTLATILVKS